MEREFVPYELALKLKALGFDEECFGFYNPTVTKKVIMNNDSYGGYGLSHDHIIVAPTFSQAFRWFRENYGYCHFINPSGKGYCSGWEDLGNNEHGFENYSTYEEAELACLEKLIEIVESKSE